MLPLNSREPGSRSLTTDPPSSEGRCSKLESSCCREQQRRALEPVQVERQATLRAHLWQRQKISSTTNEHQGPFFRRPGQYFPDQVSGSECPCSRVAPPLALTNAPQTEGGHASHGLSASSGHRARNCCRVEMGVQFGVSLFSPRLHITLCAQIDAEADAEVNRKATNEPFFGLDAWKKSH